MTDQTKHRKEIRKMLEVEYTPEEISDMGLDLARKTAELRTAEDHKKSAVSHLKSEIDSLTARTNDISNKINSGSEYRNVKCELEYNYETNKKTIIRTDTMEVVYDGEIPDDERQIPLVEPDAIEPGDGQSPEDEPKDTSPPPADGAEPQTEEIMPGEHEVDPELVKTEEEQEKLDAEDEKIKKNILIAQGSVK